MPKAILSLCLEFVCRKGQSDLSYCLDIFLCRILLREFYFYWYGSSLFFFPGWGAHTLFGCKSVTMFHHSWYLTLFSIVTDLWPCKAESIFVTYESQIFVYNLFHWTQKCIWSSCHLFSSCMRLWFSDFNLLTIISQVLCCRGCHCLGISSLSRYFIESELIVCVLWSTT